MTVVTLCILILLPATALAQEVVGERPYEMDWAGRTEDDHPPLIDFESPGDWTVETENSIAAFERTREQQIFGDYVGRFTYRFELGASTREGANTAPIVYIRPPEPVAITEPFDAVTMWIYGNNWATSNDATTPQVTVYALFTDADDIEFGVNLIRVRWEQWFLCHRRLDAEQIERVRTGATFTGFRVDGGRQPADRMIYFDNLAVFTEEFKPLTFRPRALRGVDAFPGQDTGQNTGPGRLTFPDREQTILPPNLTGDFETSVQVKQHLVELTYRGSDGTLTYAVSGQTGTWSDITARWDGLGEPFRPCVDGGVYLQTADGPVAPDSFELLGTEALDDGARMKWRVSAGEVSAEVEYVYHLWGKSLVIDTICRGGVVGEVRYGALEGLDNPRLVTNPYYHYYRLGRPAVAITGPEASPLFVTGNTDWYLSSATEPFAVTEIKDGQVFYNGGARYHALTNGQRNDCYERFFLTVTPRYEEALPTIPNPVSPWKHITGTRFWRPHGAGNRENDMKHWRLYHRYGVTEMVVTDHESMWRDEGESFTFRVNAAPKKGGDQGAYDYARFMQDELGYVYGPYNNYTDFAPVNEHWSADRVTRDPSNQLRHAWMRCYAPKYAYAVEACEDLAPQIEEKFHFSTAYCDVHTAVSPWSRVDYDPRTPGAGTFAAVLYAYGEIMMLQKKAWDGPVYSEGNMHFPYSGLTDGNYAQDRSYNLVENPWLVDFDLRRMHDLCCNFGMGMPSMYYSRDYDYGTTDAEVDANIDRFTAATVAFGHPGYLTSVGGQRRSLRGYFMLQQLHSRYCLASADEILYADAAGNLHPTTEAVATGAYKRSQVATRYSDGTVTVVNGSKTERMRVNAFGRDLDLAPNGFTGWTADGEIDVTSSDEPGHRADYAVTPAYMFADGRDTFTRFGEAATAGLGILRILDDATWELIPYQGAECGFAIPAQSAIAVDEEENELGPAEVRHARGLTYVVPVENAFSYILRAGEAAPGDLACERDMVVPGERVVVRGQQDHEVLIPDQASPGDRIWEQFEDRWIDFTVVPLVFADASIDHNKLMLSVTSNAPREDDLTFTLGDEDRTVHLKPGESATVDFDLGEPEYETVEYLGISVRAGELAGEFEYGMRVMDTMIELAELPSKWTAGMRLRDAEETTEMGTTRAAVADGERTAGGIVKRGFTGHPPYVDGVGYTYDSRRPASGLPRIGRQG